MSALRAASYCLAIVKTANARIDSTREIVVAQCFPQSVDYHAALQIIGSLTHGHHDNLKTTTDSASVVVFLISQDQLSVFMCSISSLLVGAGMLRIGPGVVKLV
jgi:hypothetical protein